MRGEDGAEEEDVEFGLVVPDQDAGSRGEVLFAGDDVEANSCGPVHGVVESAGDGVLG